MFYRNDTLITRNHQTNNIIKNTCFKINYFRTYLSYNINNKIVVVVIII